MSGMTTGYPIPPTHQAAAVFPPPVWPAAPTAARTIVPAARTRDPAIRIIVSAILATPAARTVTAARVASHPAIPVVIQPATREIASRTTAVPVVVRPVPPRPPAAPPAARRGCATRPVIPTSGLPRERCKEKTTGIRRSFFYPRQGLEGICAWQKPGCRQGRSTGTPRPTPGIQGEA